MISLLEIGAALFHSFFCDSQRVPGIFPIRLVSCKSRPDVRQYLKTRDFALPSDSLVVVAGLNLRKGRPAVHGCARETHAGKRQGEQCNIRFHTVQTSRWRAPRGPNQLPELDM